MTPIMTPMPGDFELCQISGEVGAFIRFGQWFNKDGFSKFEHARLHLGGGLCIDAKPGGASLGAMSAYDDVAHVWSTGLIPLTTAQRSKIVSAGFSYIGVDYSFADYLALFAKRMHAWLPGLNAYVKSSKHMICSQLVAQCYDDAGVVLPTQPAHTFNGDVTPGDLYKVLLQHGLKQ